jgi:hypothetical protein
MRARREREFTAGGAPEEREIHRDWAGGRPDVNHIYYIQRDRETKRYRERDIRAIFSGDVCS